MCARIALFCAHLLCFPSSRPLPTPERRSDRHSKKQECSVDLERAPSSLFLLPGRGVCPYFALRVFFAVQGCVDTRSVDSPFLPAALRATRLVSSSSSSPVPPLPQKGKHLASRPRVDRGTKPNTRPPPDATHGGRLPSSSRVCASLAHPLPHPPSFHLLLLLVRYPLLRVRHHPPPSSPHPRPGARLRRPRVRRLCPSSMAPIPPRLGGAPARHPRVPHLARRHAQLIRLCPPPPPSRHGLCLLPLAPPLPRAAR